MSIWNKLFGETKFRYSDDDSTFDEVKQEIPEEVLEEVKKIKSIRDRLFNTSDKKVIAQVNFFNDKCRIYDRYKLIDSEFNVEILNEIVTNKKYLKSFYGTTDIIEVDKRIKQREIIKELNKKFYEEYLDDKIEIFSYEGGE